MPSYYTHFEFSERPESVNSSYPSSSHPLYSFKGDEFLSQYNALSEADKGRLDTIYITKLVDLVRFRGGRICSIWRKDNGTYNADYVSLKRHTKQIDEINTRLSTT